MCLIEKYAACSPQVTLTLICMVYVLWFGFYYSWKFAPPTYLTNDKWRNIVEDDYICWYTVIQFSITIPALIGVYVKRPNFLIPLLASDLCRMSAIVVSIVYVLTPQIEITNYEETLLVFFISLGIQFYIVRVEIDAYYELKKHRTYSDAVKADFNSIVYVIDAPNEKMYSEETSKTSPIRTTYDTKYSVSDDDAEYLPETHSPPATYHEYTSLYIFEKNFYFGPLSMHSGATV